MHALLPAAAMAIPKIELWHTAPFGSIFDRGCAAADPEQVQETVRRLPEFQRQWDEEGPQYLRTALAEIGKPFPYGECR